MIKYGFRKLFALKVGLTPEMLSNCLNGKRNLSGPLADRAAAESGTDIRIWLKGGSAEARSKAVEEWARPRRKPGAWHDGT
jgi:plasmid maintenance system antidote protein VapI